MPIQLTMCMMRFWITLCGQFSKLIRMNQTREFVMSEHMRSTKVNLSVALIVALLYAQVT